MVLLTRVRVINPQSDNDFLPNQCTATARITSTILVPSNRSYRLRSVVFQLGSFQAKTEQDSWKCLFVLNVNACKTPKCPRLHETQDKETPELVNYSFAQVSRSCSWVENACDTVLGHRHHFMHCFSHRKGGKTRQIEWTETTTCSDQLQKYEPQNTQILVYLNTQPINFAFQQELRNPFSLREIKHLKEDEKAARRCNARNNPGCLHMKHATSNSLEHVPLSCWLCTVTTWQKYENLYVF